MENTFYLIAACFAVGLLGHEIKNLVICYAKSHKWRWLPKLKRKTLLAKLCCETLSELQARKQFCLVLLASGEVNDEVHRAKFEAMHELISKAMKIKTKRLLQSILDEQILDEQTEEVKQEEVKNIAEDMERKEEEMKRKAKEIFKSLFNEQAEEVKHEQTEEVKHE